MKSSKEKTLTFTVTLEEANRIFKALGKEPFQEVYELIGALNQQANQQLSEKPFRVTRNHKQKQIGQVPERKQS